MRVARVIVARNASAFARGQLLSGVTVAVLGTAAFAVLGVRWWYVLGPLVGALAMVPVVGTLVGVGLAVLAAAEGGAERMAWTLGAMVAIQAVDNFVVGPRIRGGAFQFGLVASLVIVVAGGILLAPFFGPLAPLAALPVAGMLRDGLRYRDLRLTLDPGAALAALEAEWAAARRSGDAT